jgi:hypothetical protein
MLLSPPDGDGGDAAGYHPSLILPRIPSNMPSTKPISAIAIMIGRAASTRPKRVGKRRITPSSTGPMDVLRLVAKSLHLSNPNLAEDPVEYSQHKANEGHCDDDR